MQAPWKRCKEPILCKQTANLENGYKKLDNPEHIEWEDAVDAIKEYLPNSHFKEKVVEVYERDPIYGPGKIEEKASATSSGSGIDIVKDKSYLFLGVKLKVENGEGVVRGVEYVFRFHWQIDEWKIIEPPGVTL